MAEMRDSQDLELQSQGKKKLQEVPNYLSPKNVDSLSALLKKKKSTGNHCAILLVQKQEIAGTGFFRNRKRASVLKQIRIMSKYELRFFFFNSKAGFFCPEAMMG